MYVCLHGCRIDQMQFTYSYIFNRDLRFLLIIIHVNC